MKNVLNLLVVMIIAASASAEIINFGDTGHSSTGAWAGGVEKYQATEDNGATSTMTFTDLDNGMYYVFANWSPMSNRTTVAQYDVDGVDTVVREA